jgi:hypothetical protein
MVLPLLRQQINFIGYRYHYRGKTKEMYQLHRYGY